MSQRTFHAVSKAVARRELNELCWVNDVETVHGLLKKVLCEETADVIFDLFKASPKQFRWQLLSDFLEALPQSADLPAGWVTDISPNVSQSEYHDLAEARKIEGITVLIMIALVGVCFVLGVMTGKVDWVSGVVGGSLLAAIPLGYAYVKMYLPQVRFEERLNYRVWELLTEKVSQLEPRRALRQVAG